MIDIKHRFWYFRLNKIEAAISLTQTVVSDGFPSFSFDNYTYRKTLKVLCLHIISILRNKIISAVLILSIEEMLKETIFLTKTVCFIHKKIFVVKR